MFYLGFVLSLAFPLASFCQVVVNPSAVTFIGAENAAAGAVKEVFAVQVSRTVSNAATN